MNRTFRTTKANTWTLRPLYPECEESAFILEMPYGHIKPRCLATKGRMNDCHSRRLIASKDVHDGYDEFEMALWHLEYKPEEDQSKLKKPEEPPKKTGIGAAYDILNQAQEQLDRDVFRKPNIMMD